MKLVISILFVWLNNYNIGTNVFSDNFCYSLCKVFPPL